MTNAPRPIVIVSHRPEWAAEFQTLAQTLAAALGDWALRVDHIGSTAVPGLAAKDILDAQVTVADLTPDLQAAFERAGFVRQRHNADHQPPGVAGHPRDWEKQLYQPGPGARAAHVHVRRAGSPNGRYALLFRDYLRAHPLAAAAYAQVKVALAQHGPADWDLYYDVKDPVCDLIMAGAEAWAAQTGWTLAHYT